METPTGLSFSIHHYSYVTLRQLTRTDEGMILACHAIVRQWREMRVCVDLLCSMIAKFGRQTPSRVGCHTARCQRTLCRTSTKLPLTRRRYRLRFMQPW